MKQETVKVPVSASSLHVQSQHSLLQAPQSWSTAKKLFRTVIPCLCAFLVTFGTSISEPGMPGMMVEFHISRTAAILNITLYTVGLGISPLMFAPLSEVYGRRWIYAIAYTCLLAFTAGAASSPNFTTLLVCRFLAGLSGSVGIAIGAGTIADIWPAGRERAIAVLCPYLAPTLAPFVAGKWTQWTMLLMGVPIWPFVLGMRETATDLAELKLRKSIFLPLKMLLTDLIVLSLTVHTSFGYALIFSFFSSFFYILSMDYGFDTKHASLCLIVGYFCALCLYIKRLYVATLGGFLLLVGEVWYAAGASRGGHWAILVSAGISLGCGVLALFLSSVTYITDIYSAKVVASAIAVDGALRYTLGATFPLFSVQIYEQLGIDWASAVFAFLSLLLLPTPILLCKYGRRLRTLEAPAQC
ncbi:major facilitator superfamily domain-containing protein [Aspergillus navahoensis]